MASLYCKLDFPKLWYPGIIIDPSFLTASDFKGKPGKVLRLVAPNQEQFEAIIGAVTQTAELLRPEQKQGLH